MRIQNSFLEEKPTLYLVATPIGNLEDITYRALNILKKVDYIACEDTRVTKKLCNYFDINKKLVSHHQHNYRDSTTAIIQSICDGCSVAVVSDAGYPTISDPGQELVRAAIALDIPVVSIPGANAMLHGLVVSGISTEQFMFVGFLDTQTKKKVNTLERLKYLKATLVFYESPHRIKQTLMLIETVMGNRNVAICRELTKKYEQIIRGSIQEVINYLDHVKGEIVLIVEEATENDNEDLFKNSVDEQINIYIKTGMKLNEAIKKVAKERQLSKNEVYQNYHKEKDVQL